MTRLRVELLVDDEVIASATGNNSEMFARYAWNIARHRGRSASVRILDDAVGSWGHIMVDELEQRTSSAPDRK